MCDLGVEKSLPGTSNKGLTFKYIFWGGFKYQSTSDQINDSPSISIGRFLLLPHCKTTPSGELLHVIQPGEEDHMQSAQQQSKLVQMGDKMEQLSLQLVFAIHSPWW